MALREAMHTVTERWYRTKDGQAVRASETGALTDDERVGIKLLVGPGSAIPLVDAEHYGMVPKAEPEPAPPPPVDDDLESHTKAELLEIAETKGVEIKHSLTKAEIIEAIESAD